MKICAIAEGEAEKFEPDSFRGSIPTGLGADA
jgi:hypothetical protein